MAISSIAQRRWPIFVAIVLMAPSLVWQLIDRTPWPWDPSWYGEETFHLGNALWTGHVGTWLSLLPHIMGGAKAPGIVLLGHIFVPAAHLFGHPDTMLMLSVLLVQGVTLMLAFNAVRAIAHDRVVPALAAMLSIAAAPLFVALSHYYFVEPLQLLSVAYMWWLAAKAPSLTPEQVVLHAVAAAMLAMLAKISTPAYEVFPALLVLSDVGRRWRQMSLRSMAARSNRALAIFTLLLTAITLTWYGTNPAAVIEAAQQSASGTVALDYGHRADIVTKLKYWLDIFDQQLALSWEKWLLPPLLPVILWLGRKRLEWRGLALAAAAVANIAFVLLSLSLAINEEHRYVLPLLAPLAILVGIIGTALPRLATLSLVFVFAGHAVVVNAHSLGNQTLGRLIQPRHWLFAPNPDTDWDMSLHAIVANMPRKQSHIQVVGVEYPWLNANTLSYYAAKAEPSMDKMRFTSLGYASQNVDAAWTRMERLGNEYFISIEADRQTSPPNFINLVSLPILLRVAASPDFVKLAFPSKLGVTLYNRQRPVSSKDVK